MTPAGIEPATFRFLAQHLNHCTTAVPVMNSNRVNSKEKSQQSERLGTPKSPITPLYWKYLEINTQYQYKVLQK